MLKKFCVLLLLLCSSAVFCMNGNASKSKYTFFDFLNSAFCGCFGKDKKKGPISKILRRKLYALSDPSIFSDESNSEDKRDKD